MDQDPTLANRPLTRRHLNFAQVPDALSPLDVLFEWTQDALWRPGTLGLRNIRCQEKERFFHHRHRV